MTVRPGATGAEVIALVSRMSGIRAERIAPGDRLVEDLGIDGDDAGELFEAYASEMQVDLSALYVRWRSHFGPEGFRLAAGLGLVVAASVVGSIAAWLNAPGWLAVGTGLSGGLLWLVGLRGWPFNSPCLEPVRVEDLIVAACSGRWGEAG